MPVNKPNVNEVLTQLTAHSSDELSVFRMVLYCAYSLHQRNSTSLGMSRRVSEVVSFDAGPGYSTDILQFIREIPRHSMRYFHGLVEALDIYQSIHGRPIPITIDPSDDAIRELRQIRDLCIEDGLHSIY